MCVISQLVLPPWDEILKMHLTIGAVRSLAFLGWKILHSRSLWITLVFQGIFSTSTSSCLTHFLLYLVEPLKVLSPWLKKNLSHCEGKKSISSGENIHAREGCSKPVFLSLFLVPLLPSLLSPCPPPHHHHHHSPFYQFGLLVSGLASHLYCFYLWSLRISCGHNSEMCLWLKILALDNCAKVVWNKKLVIATYFASQSKDQDFQLNLYSSSCQGFQAYWLIRKVWELTLIWIQFKEPWSKKECLRSLLERYLFRKDASIFISDFIALRFL